MPVAEEPMSETQPIAPRLYPWVLGTYASFIAAILAVLVIAGWGVYVDFEETRKGLLQAEINRLRSHAHRTVLRIQTSLSPASVDKLREGLTEMEWLREHWQTFVPSDPSRLYAAILDDEGMIVMHSRLEEEGRRLPPGWNRQVVDGVGEDVVETGDLYLNDGTPTLDISLPILVGEREIGSYHSGFNVKWFETLLTERRSATRQRWTIAFLVISLIIALAGASLYHVTRRLSTLQNALILGRVRRLADLGQLASGIAHEIRNPLNAIRINLHVLEQLIHTRNGGDERTDMIVRETVHEMERVDGLLRSLLEYARPDKARTEKINVGEEVRIIGELIRPIMERENVHLIIRAPDQVQAVIDRNRFRQVMLNLMKNALEAIGNDGEVTAELQTSGSDLILSVTDTGGGISPEAATRIYDPFFTTKELGTGLGLTLVRRYVEEAGGEVEFAPAPTQGTVFTVRWPIGRVNDPALGDSNDKLDSMDLVGT